MDAPFRRHALCDYSRDYRHRARRHLARLDRLLVAALAEPTESFTLPGRLAKSRELIAMLGECLEISLMEVDRPMQPLRS